MDDDFAREHEIRSQWDEYSTGGGFCVVLDTAGAGGDARQRNGYALLGAPHR